MNRPVGAPLGNQNARKHGFYSDALTVEDRRNLKDAAGVADLDQEINLLRAKLKSIARHDPHNLKLMSTAASALARLLRAHRNLIKDAEKDQSVGASIKRAMREIGGPLGIIDLSEKAEFDEWRKLHKNNQDLPKPPNLAPLP